MRFIVGKLWDLKLQIHMLEKECAQLVDVIGHVISLELDLYLEDINPRLLFVCVCKISRLIAKGIIRSFSMRKRRRATVKPVTGMIFDCDVCDGFMFNAQRYMHINDAYFATSTIRFPYVVIKVFDRLLR